MRRRETYSRKSPRPSACRRRARRHVYPVPGLAWVPWLRLSVRRARVRCDSRDCRLGLDPGGHQGGGRRRLQVVDPGDAAASRRSPASIPANHFRPVDASPWHERCPCVIGRSSLGRADPATFDCAAHGPSASAGAGSVVAPPTPSTDPASAPDRPASHPPRHGAPADPADGPSRWRDSAAEEARGNGSPRSTRATAAEPPRGTTARRPAVSPLADPAAISTNRPQPAVIESPAPASRPSRQRTEWPPRV